MNIKNEVQEFLSNSENYELAKNCALNIINQSEDDGYDDFVTDLDFVINTVCTLHILHKLTFDEIESHAKYIRESDMPICECDSCQGE